VQGPDAIKPKARTRRGRDPRSSDSRSRVSLFHVLVRGKGYIVEFVVLAAAACSVAAGARQGSLVGSIFSILVKRYRPSAFFLASSASSWALSSSSRSRSKITFSPPELIHRMK
jgi:hypothetical protein